MHADAAAGAAFTHTEDNTAAWTGLFDWEGSVNVPKYYVRGAQRISIGRKTLPQSSAPVLWWQRIQD
ncbi:hypothetical protein GJAV_G00185540 [Gymnothorax javanicus]|nr:hypothetical protein GJAV_G00185540 [Gymnothorax javanicus]